MRTLESRLEALERQRDETMLTPRQRYEYWRVMHIRSEAEHCGEQQTLSRYRLQELPPEPATALKDAFWRMITPADIAEAKAKLARLGNRYAPA